MTGSFRNPHNVSQVHGGQSKKRAASDMEFLGSSSRGSKRRPVRERLGIRVDSPSWDRNEDSSSLRQSGDVIYSGYGVDDDARSGEEDLRYKLMQKAALLRTQDNDKLDLREKLISMRGSSLRDAEIHKHKAESSWSNIPVLRPSSRTTNDLMRTDFSRSYSSSPTDYWRQGSGASRGLSSPRNLDRLHGQNISRDYEDVRAAPYASGGTSDATRQRVGTSRGLSLSGNPDRVQGRHVHREYEDMRLAPHGSRSMLDSPRQSSAAARGLSPPRNFNRIQGRHVSREYEDVRGAPHASRGTNDAQRLSVATARGLSPPRNLDRVQGRHISREYEDVRGVPHVSRGTIDAQRQSLATTRGLSPPWYPHRIQGRYISRGHEDARVVPRVSLDSLGDPRQSLDTPRGLSSPKDLGSPQRRDISRVYEHASIAPYARPMSSASFDTRLMLPPSSQIPPHPIISNPRVPSASLGVSSPPVPASRLLSQLPSLGNVGHRPVPLAEEHQTVDSLLKSLGLENFSILFLVDQVDMAALKHMDESDLKELGLPKGPRKKILHALRPHGDGQ